MKHSLSLLQHLQSMIVQSVYCGCSSSNTFIISRRIEVKEADTSHISGSGPFQGATIPCETFWRLNWQQVPQDASWATLRETAHSPVTLSLTCPIYCLQSHPWQSTMLDLQETHRKQCLDCCLMTVLLNVLCYHIYDIYDTLSYGGEGLEMCEALTLLCFLLYLLDLDWNEVYCCAN